jgi:mRNA interferase MazF
MEVTRGDLIIVALAGDYGKPRPALVVQSDAFQAIPSVTVLPLSGDLQEARQVRITVEPRTGTGLTRRSQVMIDKAATVPRTKIGQRIGRVDTGTMRAVDTALTGFLGLG